MMGGRFESVSQKEKLQDTLYSSLGLSSGSLDTDEKVDNAFLEGPLVLNDLRLNDLRFGWITELLQASHLEEGAVLVCLWRGLFHIFAMSHFLHVCRDLFGIGESLASRRGCRSGMVVT